MAGRYPRWAGYNLLQAGILVRQAASTLGGRVCTASGQLCVTDAAKALLSLACWRLVAAALQEVCHVAFFVEGCCDRTTARALRSLLLKAVEAAAAVSAVKWRRALAQAWSCRSLMP